MIKAVIFDIGGVILNGDKIALSVNDAFLPEDPIRFWQDLNERFSTLCRGEGTLLGFWKDLARSQNKNIPEKILKKLWVDDFEKSLVVNKDVYDIILGLKKNYKLAIISNIIKEHASLLNKNPQFASFHGLFDIVTYSYEVKMSKDSKEIFDYTLKKLNVLPEECVFTDDILKFVVIARSVGIHSYQFRNAEQFRKDLKELGVKI